MLYRLASYSDDCEVLAAFELLELRAPQYKFSRRPSARMGFDYYWELRKQNNAYIVDESFLLLVQSGQAWHGEDTCLEEVLVLRIRADGSIHKVAAALEAIARWRGVSAIITHDSSLNFRMGSLYKRAGYIPITQTYYKELNYGSMDR